MEMLKIHAEASERHHLGLRTQVDMKKARNSPCLLKVLWKQLVPVSPLPALLPRRLFLVYSAWSRTKLKLFCSFCYQRWQELLNNILSFVLFSRMFLSEPLNWCVQVGVLQNLG